jgi:hypothetical protein
MADASIDSRAALLATFGVKVALACPLHAPKGATDSTMRHYCVDDRAPVCAICMGQEHRGHMFRLITDVAPKLRMHLNELSGPIGAWPEMLPEPWNLAGPPLSPNASNPFPPTGRTAEVELQALMTSLQVALSSVSSNAATALSDADEAHRVIVAASLARRDALKASIQQYRETKMSALQIELQVCP